jgi:hypothetical protein
MKLNSSQLRALKEIAISGEDGISRNDLNDLKIFTNISNLHNYLKPLLDEKIILTGDKLFEDKRGRKHKKKIWKINPKKTKSIPSILGENLQDQDLSKQILKNLPEKVIIRSKSQANMYEFLEILGSPLMKKNHKTPAHKLLKEIYDTNFKKIISENLKALSRLEEYLKIINEQNSAFSQIIQMDSKAYKELYALFKNKQGGKKK